MKNIQYFSVLFVIVSFGCIVSDANPILDAINQLRKIFPDNENTRTNVEIAFDDAEEGNVKPLQNIEIDIQIENLDDSQKTANVKQFGVSHDISNKADDIRELLNDDASNKQEFDKFLMNILSNIKKEEEKEELKKTVLIKKNLDSRDDDDDDDDDEDDDDDDDDDDYDDEDYDDDDDDDDDELRKKRLDNFGETSKKSKVEFEPFNEVFKKQENSFDDFDNELGKKTNIVELKPKRNIYDDNYDPYYHPHEHHPENYYHPHRNSHIYLEDDFKCPTNRDGIFINLQQCNKYYLCQAGYKTIIACHHGYSFDTRSRRCLPITIAIC